MDLHSIWDVLSFEEEGMSNAIKDKTYLLTLIATSLFLAVFSLTIAPTGVPVPAFFLFVGTFFLYFFWTVVMFILLGIYLVILSYPAHIIARSMGGTASYGDIFKLFSLASVLLIFGNLEYWFYATSSNVIITYITSLKISSLWAHLTFVSIFSRAHKLTWFKSFLLLIVGLAGQFIVRSFINGEYLLPLWTSHELLNSLGTFIAVFFAAW